MSWTVSRIGASADAVPGSATTAAARVAVVTRSERNRMTGLLTLVDGVLPPCRAAAQSTVNQRNQPVKSLGWTSRRHPRSMSVCSATWMVSVGDQPVVIAGRQQRLLLMVMALRANQVVVARAADRRSVGPGPSCDRRRRTAGLGIEAAPGPGVGWAAPGALLTRPGGYVLVLESDRTDIARFERLLACARASGDPAAPRAPCSRRHCGCGADPHWRVSTMIPWPLPS